MKKSLVALAALAFVGVASAQSSVTLFGVVDAAYEHLSGSALVNGSVNKLVQGANSPSRLGFRGTEDLGGGLNAGFWLEAGLNNDSGAGAATNTNNQATGGAPTGGLGGGQGLTFNRRSTVSLAGNFGEVRLGRDYTPTFWNKTIFDPFGTVGVGQESNLSLAVLTTATGVRASNSVGYFLPGNLGGFYGQVMYAMGENSSNAANSNDGNYAGGRIGYANGPVNVAISYGKTKNVATDGYSDANIGGSWNFGVATVMAQYNQEKVSYTPANTNKTYLLGVNVPVGPGNIVASYNHAKTDGDEFKANQYALGYVYNLSKRTAIYGTYAHISNSGSAGSFTTNGLPSAVAGGSSNGLDIGLRTSF